jgi:hypothetical protein
MKKIKCCEYGPWYQCYKTFFFVTDNKAEQASAFALSLPFQTNIILENKGKANLSAEPLRVSHLGLAPGLNLIPGNTKGGSITVPLTSCLTGLGSSVLQMKTKIVSYHTADSKPVKQEANSTVILPPLVFPAYTYDQAAKSCLV